MKRFILLLPLFMLAQVVLATETAKVIKVRGTYGIIDKGTNQGMSEGLELFVKRPGSNGLIDIGKVKVIRTTANRAAVEQVGNSKVPFLQKGDQLFAHKSLANLSTDTKTQTSTVEEPPGARRLEKPATQNPSDKPQKPAAISGPVGSRKEIPVPETKRRTFRNYDVKRPWISFNVGAIVPSGELATAYVPSVKVGASYMLSSGNHFNFGVEINKTFFGISSFGAANVVGSSTVSSSSVLEGFAVFQRFFGENIFFETGGGIYRPKIETVSIDNVRSSFSSSHFGIFGGAGFFLPTSPYAGITFKGRLHNYFDQKIRQYFGITGGFRFKVQ